MLISSKYNFIYIDIPKTGSRSAQNSLKRLDNFAKIAPLPIMTKGQFKNKHIGNIHTRIIPDYAKNYTKIITVRNPYNWAISHWYWYNRRTSRQYPLFDNINDFMDYCIWCVKNHSDNEEDIAIYRHFPIWKYTKPIGYDIFLKLENINEEIKKLPFLPENFKWDFIGKNKHPSTSKILDKKLIKQINEWAGDDFKLFGYEKYE